MTDLRRFAHLTFDRFKELARDESLSQHEKIGFPDSYREGLAGAILRDVRGKLRHLERDGARVMDIGPGCGELAMRLIEHCRERRQPLVLVDSDAMLSQLPDDSFITKIPGRFPDDCRGLLAEHDQGLDAILVYSVLHYVFAEADPAAFLDAALGLLDHGGELLIGDIPNASKRARFFASPAGVQCHEAFTGGSGEPLPTPPSVEDGAIDDAALLALMMRARNSGFEAYVIPQGPDLPMESRREDLLFRRL